MSRSTFALRGSFFHRKPDPQAGSDYKPSGPGREYSEEKVVEIAESFSELKNLEKASVAQFAQESSSQRAVLQKVYERTLLVRDESTRRWLIGLGSLIFLGLFALGAVGYHKLNRMGKMLLLFLLIGANFSVGACSYGPKEPAKKNPNQERLEQSLAVVTQSSRRMEETFSQSIVLADLARQWSKIEAGPSEKAFQLSWQIALRAREKANQVTTLEAVISRGLTERWPKSRGWILILSWTCAMSSAL